MALTIFNQRLHELRIRSSEKWLAFPAGVLPAFVAEMDCTLAPAIAQTLRELVERGDTGYAVPREVREPFAAFTAKRYLWRPDPRGVFGVPDVMSGIAQAMHVLTGDGAPIVINPPVYPPFFEVIPNYRRRVVEVPLRVDEARRWGLDFDALECTFAELGRGAAYLLCSPHNPVGRVWSREDLARIVELCAKYGVALISDEIHAPLILPGAGFSPVLPIANDAGIPAIAMHSASKGWNLAGLKCGLMVAGDTVRDRLHAHLKSIPTEINARVGHFGVRASITAFEHSVQWLDALIAELDANRAHVVAQLGERFPQIRFDAPEGTYLAWLDCGGLDLGGASDAASFFLNRGKVALERGGRFGREGERYVRLNFATSREVLEEIFARMASAI